MVDDLSETLESISRIEDEIKLGREWIGSKYLYSLNPVVMEWGVVMEDELVLVVLVFVTDNRNRQIDYYCTFQKMDVVVYSLKRKHHIFQYRNLRSSYSNTTWHIRIVWNAHIRLISVWIVVPIWIDWWWVGVSWHIVNVFLQMKRYL